MTPALLHSPAAALDRMAAGRAPLALLIGLGTAAALLAGAHLFERVGGLDPCLLCLKQREVHWTALAIGAPLAVFFALRPAGPVLRVGALGLVAAVFLYSAGLGAYHAGVEWDFWDGPKACGATVADGGVPSSEDLLSSLAAPGPEGPSCEIALWRFLGISMAGYNALISLGIAALLGAAAWRLARPALHATSVAGGSTTQ